MYSPKISEELIPELYRLSKEKGKPMTKVIDEIVRNGLKRACNIKFLQVKEVSGTPVISPSAVAEMMKEEAKIDRECLWVLHLNIANKIIEKELVSMGTVAKSLVHCREVYRRAIANGSTAIVTIHNHPGGQVKPSDEDLRVWDMLNEAGKLLKIDVLDHLIITPAGGYYSRKEAGL
ncbi:MAG: JAB domain-containing protein [bacterium]|nr:JAB domain-containing protein [bacterium]